MSPSQTDASTAGTAVHPAGEPAPEAAGHVALPPAKLKARIREEALALGFDAVGFASAAESPHAERLREWVAAGRHATMSWMTRDLTRRSDPRVVLPGAKTVISVAVSYYRGGWTAAPTERSGSEPDGGPGTRGLIARYAWGRDYHKRIRSRLRRLARVLRGLSPGAAWFATVDTGPVLDRSWAEQAGVGWIGKNTNLIRKGAGSWCFLGEILTDVALEPDRPAANYCGRCARCITACPTGAIVGPYRVDARRCISYLTIEHRGPIPPELRPLIGTRIFGCDDCQEVCPWNRFAVSTSDPDFADRSDQKAPKLIPLLALDEESFRARFRGSAVLRAKRSGFVRNVAVALGNSRDLRAVPALSRALEQDPDPVVRGHAAWALGRIGGREARAALAHALSHETSGEVVSEARAALTEGALPSGAPESLHHQEGEIVT